MSMVAALCLALPGTAFAQALPNYGNYQTRTANYRVGVQIVSTTNQTVAQSFEQDQIEDVQTYLDPQEIVAALIAGGTNAAQATFLTQVGAISEVFDLLGAPVLAGYQLGSSTLTVRFVNADGSTLNLRDGTPCAFTYNGTTRQQSYNSFDTDTDGDTPTGTVLARCLGYSRARNSPVDPLVGNPLSLQASMTRAALDFTEGDSLAELGDRANSAGDPFIIGATYSFGHAGRFDTDRIDARINKGWRILEGSRARLKFDLPFSYTRIGRQSAYAGQLALGLEYPVQPNWSLEPRVAYGLTYSAGLGSAGHILQGSIASRYVIRNIGRGQILIGNLAGYSQTLSVPGDVNLNPDIGAFTFRNGVAYELPLKGLIGRRAASVRASYSFTNYAGVKLRNNSFHEATLSFGLRGREDTPKQFRDIVRLNLNTVQARGYHAYTAGLGFRF